MGRVNKDMVFELIGLRAVDIAAIDRSFGVNQSSAIRVVEKRPHPRQAVHDAACLMSRSCDSVDSWLTIATAPTKDSLCEVLLANQNPPTLPDTQQKATLSALPGHSQDRGVSGPARQVAHPPNVAGEFAGQNTQPTSQRAYT